MSLSLAEVKHIAKLAHLDLDDEETMRYREQLSAILDYAARLQALDTEAIAPTATILPVDSVMRPDEPRPSMDRDELLLNAPETRDGMFQVPPILE